MKKIKYLVPILAFAFFSCDNYLDINSPSPNDLAFTNALPSKLLPGAEVSAYRVQATQMSQLGNVFMNSWTRNVASFGNGYDSELQLQVTNSFYNGIWNGLYVQLKNFDAIIKYPNPTGKFDYAIAAAKICKVHYMQQIVDLYGDCPYSKAFLGIENTTPAYDDDYSIYQALFTELETARDLIANADSNVVEDITTYDVMLSGDMAKWTEFANTIQLRMCVHMSEVTGAKATFRDTKLADIAAGPFLSDNVKVNPGFTTAVDQQNPAVGFFLYDPAGNNLQNRTFITMTGHAYKSLQSYATTNWPVGANYEIVPGSGVNYPNVTDPRSARLFTAGAAGNPRRAVTQGSSTVDVSTPTGIGTGLQLPCRVGLAGNYNPYGLATTYDSIDGFIMTLSESDFLLAEAALRWPSLFSGAQTYFQDAITDNFLIRNAVVGSYITTINTKPNFGWTGTDTQKLHAIMYQKWVALMGVFNPIQSYIDYTRTGFPYTPISSSAVQTRKPYRLIYPVSEYVANSANVPSLTTSEVFIINNKTPFWVPGAPN
jgi:Starch-binding associating with outer membrane